MQQTPSKPTCGFLRGRRCCGVPASSTNFVGASWTKWFHYSRCFSNCWIQSNANQQCQSSTMPVSNNTIKWSGFNLTDSMYRGSFNRHCKSAESKCTSVVSGSRSIKHLAIEGPVMFLYNCQSNRCWSLQKIRSRWKHWCKYKRWCRVVTMVSKKRNMHGHGVFVYVVCTLVLSFRKKYSLVRHVSHVLISCGRRRWFSEKKRIRDWKNKNV